MKITKVVLYIETIPNCWKVLKAHLAEKADLQSNPGNGARIQHGPMTSLPDEVLLRLRYADDFEFLLKAAGFNLSRVYEAHLQLQGASWSKWALVCTQNEPSLWDACWGLTRRLGCLSKLAIVRTTKSAYRWVTHRVWDLYQYFSTPRTLRLRMVKFKTYIDDTQYARETKARREQLISRDISPPRGPNLRTPKHPDKLHTPRCHSNPTPPCPPNLTTSP